MATCRGCGAEIAWLTTENVKLMPVNVPPLKVLVSTGEAAADGRPIYKVVTGYAAHWATCPKADDFRAEKPTPA